MVTKAELQNVLNVIDTAEEALSEVTFELQKLSDEEDDTSEGDEDNMFALQELVNEADQIDGLMRLKESVRNLMLSMSEPKEEKPEDYFPLA